MTETVFRCNRCKKMRGESNHWIAMRTQARGTILPALTVISFEDCGQDDEHYCSPACATSRFAEFVDQLRAESVELARKNAEEAKSDVMEFVESVPR